MGVAASLSRRRCADLAASERRPYSMLSLMMSVSVDGWSRICCSSHGGSAVLVDQPKIPLATATHGEWPAVSRALHVERSWSHWGSGFSSSKDFLLTEPANRVSILFSADVRALPSKIDSANEMLSLYRSAHKRIVRWPYCSSKHGDKRTRILKSS